MNTDASGSGTGPVIFTHARAVSLSKWVNEKLPAWHEILSAHEVARLTRRNRCVLIALTLLGRFPRPQRLHGRRIGWLRREVEQWIARVRDDKEATPSPGDTAASAAAVVHRGHACSQSACRRAQPGAGARWRIRRGAEQWRKTRRVARAARAATTPSVASDGRELEP